MHWCVMVDLPMESRNSSAVPAADKAERIPHHMRIQKNAGRRSCMPMRSAAACGGLSRPWVYPVRRSSPGEKKAASLPALHETLLEPDGSEEAPILALDELWSDVAKKTNQAWIWIALCRKTRQVVAYAIGDRSETPCRWLWEAIPSPYRPGHCFTDFWKANPRSDPRRPA